MEKNANKFVASFEDSKCRQLEFDSGEKPLELSDVSIVNRTSLMDRFCLRRRFSIDYKATFIGSTRTVKSLVDCETLVFVDLFGTSQTSRVEKLPISYWASRQLKGGDDMS